MAPKSKSTPPPAPPLAGALVPRIRSMYDMPPSSICPSGEQVLTRPCAVNALMPVQAVDSAWPLGVCRRESNGQPSSTVLSSPEGLLPSSWSVVRAGLMMQSGCGWPRGLVEAGLEPGHVSRTGDTKGWAAEMIGPLLGNDVVPAGALSFQLVG